MRLDRDNQDRTWEPEDDGQWTKEEAKRDPRFDFAAFLGPESLEDQITDVLDGKDLLDEEAYGEFAPDYVPRRGAPGERGRHEAPGPEPEEEEETPDDQEETFDDGLETRRFTEDEMDFDEDEEQDFQEDLPQRAAFVDEPPPRPKVVVAQPPHTVYVDPQSEYGPEEPSGGGGGSGLKWVIALLISAAVVVGGLLFATMILPDLGGDPSQTEEPASTNSGLLSGLLRPRATQAPASEPTPVQQSAPPAVKTYTITVTAGAGGSITPNGRVTVEEGSSASFTILPDQGYELAQLLIDGSNVSIQDNYTFSDVRQDHQIYAVFQASQVITEPPPPTAAPTDEPTPEPVLTPEPPPVVEGEVGNLGPEAME